MSVAAFPMSIWPHAMSKARPSREMDLVRPVIACLVGVGAATGGGGGGGGWGAFLVDPPAGGVLGFHHLDRVVGAQESAGQVGVDGLPPAGGGDLIARTRRAKHARVVDQQINPLPS